MKPIFLFTLLIAFTAPAISEVQPEVDCDFDLLNAHIGEGPLGMRLITSVPEDSLHACDFYAMGWNNFLYLAATDESTGAPRMISYAPWYFLEPDADGNVTPFPGGKAELVADEIGKFMGQAGDGWDLHTKANQPVVYDVRMNEVMYDYIVENQAYDTDVLATNTGYQSGGEIVASDAGNLKLSFPPNEPFFPPGNPVPVDHEEGSIEYKSAWVNFGSSDACPSSELYCEGEFGLVGMHIAQKTPKHGEWIWWSFEFIGNSPDCKPTMEVDDDLKVFGTSFPISSRDDWLFFDKTEWSKFQPDSDSCATPTSDEPFQDSSIKLADICSGTSKAPTEKRLCNQNPMIDFQGDTSNDENYAPVNVCRTDSLPNAAAIREAGLCLASGTQGLQSAQVSCLNDDVTSGARAVNTAVSQVWRENYMQIGSNWTLPAVSVEAPYNRGNVIIADDEKKGFINLANTTLETWMQKGAHSPYCKSTSTTSADGDCTTTHEPATWQQTDCLVCHKALFKADPVNAPGQLPELPREGRVDFSHLLERLVHAESVSCAN